MEAHPEYLLRIGDTALVLAQQLSKWVGDAPTLEEELAMANISLDLLGQATLTLDLAAMRLDNDRFADADALAFQRDANEYRNALLAERPNGDFAQTMVRQFLYAAFAKLQWGTLIESSDAELSGIAEKAVKEVTYHLQHTASWVIRLGAGTAESKRRSEHAINELWPFVGELFSVDEVDRDAAENDVAPPAESLRNEWLSIVDEVFTQASLETPTLDIYMQSGGKTGHHTEALGFILAEMQFLQRAYPKAVW